MSTKWKTLIGELCDISFSRSGNVELDNSTKSYFREVENVSLGKWYKFPVRDLKKVYLDNFNEFHVHEV